jgi:hypothetical protein
VIIGYTAVVLVLYTIETALMREEMVRQTDLQLRPTIAGVMDETASDYFTIKLINLGQGGAVNVETVSVKSGDGTRIKNSKINVPPDVIPSGATVEWCGWPPSKEAYTAWELRLEYDRVDCHRRYYSVLLLNPGECLLAAHGEVAKHGKGEATEG